MATVLVYSTTRYDYFMGGSKEECYTFTNIIEGMKAYREDCKRSFNYGDSWFEVHKPCLRYVPEKIANNRLHARSKQEWEKIKSEFAKSINNNEGNKPWLDFSDEELNHLESIII